MTEPLKDDVVDTCPNCFCAHCVIRRTQEAFEPGTPVEDVPLITWEDVHRIGEAWGIDSTNFHPESMGEWAEDWPKPLVAVRGNPIWWKPTIEKWFREHRTQVEDRRKRFLRRRKKPAKP